MKAEALVTQFQENDREYLRIRNVVEKKVYSALSNGAKLLKLAVSIVIQSIRNDPEQYLSIIQNNFSPMSYNKPAHPFYTDDYLAQHFETILVNDAAKVYSNLAKNLIDEILSKYDIRTSQSSLPLILPSDQDYTQDSVHINI